VADAITHLLRIGYSGENITPKIDDFALNYLNFSLSEIESIIAKIDAQIKECEDLVLQET
jgi:hypothetical protein